MLRSNCTPAVPPPPPPGRAAIKDRRYASWDGDVEGMCVQVSCCLWGLWRKAPHTSWSRMIKALTGPDYMSQPGGGVRVSFLRRRKSIRWERGGAVPTGVRFCVNASTHLVRWTAQPLTSSHPTPLPRPHQTNALTPSHLTNHARPGQTP